MARVSRSDRAAREQRDEDQDSPPSQRTGKQEETAQASAITDEILDDIDRALQEACGFGEDEVVSDADLTRRAASVVEGYVQKGGQ